MTETPMAADGGSLYLTSTEDLLFSDWRVCHPVALHVLRPTKLPALVVSIFPGWDRSMVSEIWAGVAEVETECENFLVLVSRLGGAIPAPGLDRGTPVGVAIPRVHPAAMPLELDGSHAHFNISWAEVYPHSLRNEALMHGGGGFPLASD